MKVIETNLSLNGNHILDHQSRIIEIDSWEELIEEVKEARCILRYGTLHGVTIPRNAEVFDLIYDDHHMSCLVINYAGKATKKLFYVINKDY